MGKRKRIIWIPVLILLLAAAVIPVKREIRQRRESHKQIEKLESQLALLDGQALALQRKLAGWYNYNLDVGTPGLEDTYDVILNFGNGAMAVLEVPDMQIRLPVFHGENDIAGHMPDSDFPVGIRGSHTVLTVGKWYPWKKGMAVYIDCLGSRLVYQVESIQVMQSGWPAQWPSEQDRLTILCDQGDLRTIVRCVRNPELTVRREENKPDFCVEALAAALLLPVLMLRFRALHPNRRSKYNGFHHKNRRKSKLLRNYSCNILKIDV